MCNLVGWHAIFRQRNQVAKLLQEFMQFVEAAMHITDDVEGAMLVPEIGPEARALKLNGHNLLRRIQDEDVVKALIFEAAQGFTELHGLIAHDMRAEIAIRAQVIALMADAVRQVKDNCY